MLNKIVFTCSFLWNIIKESGSASLMEMLLKKLNKTEPVIEYTAPTPATAKDSGVIDFMDEKQRFEAAVTTIRYESLDEEKYIHLN